jgi:holo-[acyl-carrier protein] synthase
VDAPGPRVSIGSDIVEVARVERLITRYERAERRLFTEDEIDYCRARRNWHEHMAARFAAKEAVLKALGVGIGACSLREIEVVSQPSGAPELVLHGTAARLAGDRGVTRWHISLTHTSSLAQATVVATADPA